MRSGEPPGVTDAGALAPPFLPRPAPFERIAKWVCIAIMAVLVLHTARSVGYWDKGTHDHSVYWMAGERMAAGDESLYDAPSNETNMVGAFIYPPAFAVVFAPFTFLPRQFAYVVWAGMQLVFISMAAWLLLKTPRARSWQTGCWVLLALLWPLMANISAGQINTLVLLLCVAGWHQLERGHDLRAGSCFALGAHIKVLPVVLFWFLVAQRRAKAAAGMAAAGLLFMLLPLVWMVPAHGVSGGFSATWRLNASYAQRLIGTGAQRESSSGWNADIDMWRKAEGNLAFAGMAERHLQAGAPRKQGMWLGFLVALAMYIAALVLAWKARDSTARLGVMGLLMAAAVLGNQLAWQAHLVLLVMVVLPVVADCRGKPPRWYFAAMAVYMLLSELPPLLGYQLVFPNSVYVVTAAIQSYGAATLGVCVLWAASGMYWFRRRASDPDAVIADA